MIKIQTSTKNKQPSFIACKFKVNFLYPISSKFNFSLFFFSSRRATVNEMNRVEKIEWKHKKKKLQLHFQWSKFYFHMSVVFSYSTNIAFNSLSITNIYVSFHVTSKFIQLLCCLRAEQNYNISSISINFHWVTEQIFSINDDRSMEKCLQWISKISSLDLMQSFEREKKMLRQTIHRNAHILW